MFTPQLSPGPGRQSRRLLLTRRAWLRLLWIVVFLLLLDLLPQGLLAAGLIAVVIISTDMRGASRRLRAWSGWTALPGLSHRTRRRSFIPVLAVYLVLGPGLITLGWVLESRHHPGVRVFGHNPFWGQQFADPGLPSFPSLAQRFDPPPPPAQPSVPTPVPGGYLHIGPGAPPAAGGGVSPTPSLTPTGPSVTASPSPGRPRSTPTASPQGPALSADIQKCAAQGATETISVHTGPRFHVDIVVTYPDGTTTNPGSTSGTSDSSGGFHDVWTISQLDPTGAARVTITVRGSGTQASSASGTFTIYNPYLGSCP